MIEQEQHFNYVLIANSDGFKACRVLESLTKDVFFTPQNCLLLVNKDKGKLVSLARVLEYNVVVIGTRKLEDILKDFSFDYLISCGWNKKISEKALGMANKESINCHSSYLPDYKGAGAYKHAWANLEPFAGATVHIMTPKFDSGNILAQAQVKIFWWDTPGSILERIAEMTTVLLCNAILKINAGYYGRSQKGATGRYFYKTHNAKLILFRFANIILSPFKRGVFTTRHKNI